MRRIVLDRATTQFYYPLELSSIYYRDLLMYQIGAAPWNSPSHFCFILPTPGKNADSVPYGATGFRCGGSPCEGRSTKRAASPLRRQAFHSGRLDSYPAIKVVTTPRKTERAGNNRSIRAHGCEVDGHFKSLAE